MLRPQAPVVLIAVIYSSFALRTSQICFLLKSIAGGILTLVDGPSNLFVYPEWWVIGFGSLLVHSYVWVPNRSS